MTITVELLEYLSLGSFIIAAVLAVVSISIFFLNDIPAVYGEVSGKTAKKAIENIKQNSGNGKSTYSSSRKKNVKHAYDTSTDKLQQTVKLSYEQLTSDAPAQGQTTVLADNVPTPGQTTVLANDVPTPGQTTVLANDVPTPGQTTVLDNQNTQSGYGMTSDLLSRQDSSSYVEPVYSNTPFSIEIEMSFTDSTEIIE